MKTRYTTFAISSLRRIILLTLLLPAIHLNAQNYLLSFTGTGGSTTIDTVIVENITQGTSLVMNGNDLLWLVSVVTGIDPIPLKSEMNLCCYPNPVVQQTTLRFTQLQEQQTRLSLYDALGKLILEEKHYLKPSDYSFSLTGLSSGTYSLVISSGSVTSSLKILSVAGSGGTPRLRLQGSSPIISPKTNKSSQNLVVMQYNANDRLQLTGVAPGGIARVALISTSDMVVAFEIINCIDSDQNRYATVKIGNQTWMAENLKTTKYSDGSDIPLITDSVAWSMNRDPAYCWQDNNEAVYKNMFGGMYTWYAVSTGQLCPTGWHVPSFNEFTELQDYLISNGYNYDNTTSGNKIGKAVASPVMIFMYLIPSTPIMWDQDAGTGVVGNSDFPMKQNASGFSAVPAGFRVGDGSFSPYGHLANFWTSSVNQNIPTQSWYWHLQYNFEDFCQLFTAKWVGFPVRCMKD